MKKFMYKYRVLLLVEALLLLLALAGCLQKEKCVYSASAEEIAEALGNNGDHLYFQSGYFSLKPGVYQVRAVASIPEGSSLFLNLQNDIGTYRAVRCNGAMMFAGLEYLDFEAYLTDSADSVYVKSDYYGKEQASLISLEVYRTSMGYRMLAFLVAAFSMLLNLLLLFREKNKGQGGKQAVFWILAGSVLLAFFPYATDYMNIGADTTFHLLRIEGLKETLMQGGQFPVRVQSYWLYDHGYATSYFYGDLFLLIPAVLRLIGFSLMNSYKIFVLITMGATAAIAYYSFRGCTGNSRAALFGSVLYMLAPYRIYNFYNIGAVGEYLGMTFLPLICYGMYRIYAEDIHSGTYNRAKIPIIIGLSCVLQSHLLSAEMTGGFILVVCLIMWRKTFRKKTFIQLAEAAGITLLLNCWFWLPLLHMMWSDRYVLQTLLTRNIQSKGTLLAGVLQLFPDMGAAQTGMFHCEPIQIGAAALLMLCLYWFFAWMRYSSIHRGGTETDKTGNVVNNGAVRYDGAGKMVRSDTAVKSGYSRLMILLSVMIVGTWFMSTKYFPWDPLSEISGISFFVTALQFPTRLMAPASVLCAMFAAFFYCWVKEKETFCSLDGKSASVISRGSILFIALIALFSAVYHVNDIAFEMEPVRLYTAENLGKISVSNGEYLLEGTRPDQFSYHGPVTEKEPRWWNYHKNGTNLELQISNAGDREAYMELPVTGYKGYRLTCEGGDGELPFITEERGQHEDLRIAVPAGFEGKISVQYTGFLINRAAEGITLVTLAGIMVYEVHRRRKGCSV